MELRHYQKKTLDAINSELKTNNRVAAVLATGLGKTVIFSELTRHYVAQGMFVLIIVHREELITQTMIKIKNACPGKTVGIVKGTFNVFTTDIVVASIQTLSRESRYTQIPPDIFDLIIVDECHHGAASTWKKTLKYFGAYDSVPTVGFTATMSRADGKKLGDLWPVVATTYDIEYGVLSGHLVPVNGVRVSVKNLMLERVKLARGDLATGDLGQALTDADAGSAIADAYRLHADGRRAVLFLPDVSTVKQFTSYLNEAGIPAAYIVGSTPSLDREIIFGKFKHGDIKILASCMVLTEGWDMPCAEVAIMGRPTKNSALYQQCVGRVLRPSPETGKESALVIDLVGTTESCQLATLVDLFPSQQGLYPDGQKLPVKKDKSAPLPTEVQLRADGELVSQHVELLQGSGLRWLQSADGLGFIPITGGLVYLWPTSLGWGVGVAPIAGRKQWGKVIAKKLSFIQAVKVAENYSLETDKSIASKGSAWRSKKCSPEMLRLAKQFNLNCDGFRQGTVSDMVAIYNANKSLPTPESETTHG